MKKKIVKINYLIICLCLLMMAGCIVYLHINQSIDGAWVSVPFCVAVLCLLVNNFIDDEENR